MRIEIDSDTMCPWRYAGKRRVALAALALRPPCFSMWQRNGMGVQYVKCSARRTSRRATAPAILQVFERLQRLASAS